MKTVLAPGAPWPPYPAPMLVKVPPPKVVKEVKPPKPKASLVRPNMPYGNRPQEVLQRKRRALAYEFIERSPKCTMAQIAEYLGVSVTCVSEYIKFFQSAGLITGKRQWTPPQNTATRWEVVKQEVV